MGTGAGQRDHEGRVIDFGRTATDYERFRPGFPASFINRLVDDGWAVPGERALDLGTGTGTLALGFAERGLDVTGLDIAVELLDVARRAATDKGLSATFVVGRAEESGLESMSFDLVSAGQCWWWFDEEEVMAEVSRVLAPEGRLLICSFSYLPLTGNVAGRTEDLILEHNPGWPKARWRSVHPEQVAALDLAGFKRVESYSYQVDVPFSHEAWRGRIQTCNGVGSALRDEEAKRFDIDLAAMLEDEFPGELNVPHRIFAVSGLKP
jgi:ubiquinone/menaquinone biosynthesis C-methylase UbiE